MKAANKYFDKLDPLIKTLPDKPGIYQYFDSNGKILYIGKAKNLRKRVSSYFTKDHPLSGKLRVLVKKIYDIQHTVVDTELDALLLENNLVKEYQPRYNVMLKDDKTFPWICIKKEPFPRIFSTRNLIRDGSEYFGPYASVRMMNTLLDLIRQLYQLRTCKYNLSQENIKKRRYKVCLEYHLGNCQGPCEGLQDEEDYNQTIASIRDIIRGNITLVIERLKSLMKEYAGRLEFEKAQSVKEKLELLQRYRSKSTVVNPRLSNLDVYSLVDNPDVAYVNYMKVIQGAIVQSHTIELVKKLDEVREDLLTTAVLDLHRRFESNATEAVIPFAIPPVILELKFTIPARGDKKQLLELSERNARFYRLEKKKQLELTDPERHTHRLMSTMMSDLKLSEEPRRIECFDNSNIMGDFPVAAMVCFLNGKPAKKEYRHFNIKTVTGPDDYASMSEIVYRRYKRVLEERLDLPQLIVIDGGKGQLNAAIKSLEKLGLNKRIRVVGLAKKLEEIYYPDDPVPLYLDKKSETLRVIRQLRDEAHRFGITHHRTRREKGTIKTELTGIQGIGPETAEKLLKRFKSVKNIKTASLAELAAIIGNAKAGWVYEYFSAKIRHS
ncbi:MAG: excinuclease ABC subunit UvrC [Bacteroidales bacterium]|nr:excinuclease ABC subunit UvrC [Bacteroidales bacterium]